MRGLLLKDFYMAIKYCRAYLLIAAVFTVVSFFNRDNLFLVFYPCMICGIIPVNLLAYDERSRWLSYSETMPYTKAQIVSGKYIMGLLAQGAMLLITGISQAVQMRLDGSFMLKEYLVIMSLILILSLLSSSISLPFIFKLGVEKGRMAYYIMIGVICGGSLVLSKALTKMGEQTIRMNGILLLVLAVGIGIYVLSWYMSIVFFQKREIH